MSCLGSGNSHSLVLRKHKPVDRNQTYINQPHLSLDGAKVLFIVNPTAGAGKTSKSKLQETVAFMEDMIAKAGGLSFVRYTEHADHAVQMILEYDMHELNDFAAIAIAGGDGSIHQVCNGLSQAAVKYQISHYDRLPPIAIVPLGSGNAIASSTGLWSSNHALQNIIHGIRYKKKEPFCLLKYTPLNSSKEPLQEKGLLAIGGMQMGMPADVDHDTENLRWMGDLRYTVGTISYIFSGKSSFGEFEIITDPEKQKAIGLPKRKRHLADDLIASDDVTSYKFSGSFTLAVAWNSSNIASDFQLLPHASITELGVFDFIIIRHPLSKLEMLKMLTAVEKGEHLKNNDAYYYFKATKITCHKLEVKYLTVDGEDVDVGPYTLEAVAETPLSVLNSFAELEED